MKWITINKLSELTGYSENAIRAKIKKGVWLMGRHCTKAPDGRVLFNPEAINAWVEGR
ncbi:excisionase [Mariprofundus sp. EBB-1]|uniref:excisionase family protein n=1 Tax=Mariprofundus sp. EBB-1 TaxID=2650971 RepID=UPI000EF1956C|nr:excisionase family protein [Mariprofundus sp. EBB-1]RLL52308.1 excisionase [Mariprofundus sp. EBB-1]